ncbi:pre-mRNA-splicing factor SLU7, putative [Plasmodium chabaudi chabaudi]|uniref:Pre-mRNA-splicing factor SLU7 n=1 Tax=Plasmodium chabaudi chabaudi TaxID=31271 RepID=A0A077TG69_PLACU|nr:pre-mRNA-splicing factor SLU7, putative [Plasmodium chabaudi chabaudi]SCN58728.1 pre-mRNA-splicing factor SLU7, putative [Plasmodium chabaudi chabaudi]VTZ66273.1 pre-mRNA-splicing factor SLU7, putative [Plasmodium chabaudi chabaudi]|eukprot:XP_016653006.1 pre-mRNA-splicing factor SLU7, putative [Plasmodium chabaudi chabaudi]
MNSKNATREEKKKEKELNEARKAGKIEALKDEEGNDINPHMPQYILKAPWYLNQTKPGLKHQRYREADKVKIEEERNRKVFVKNTSNKQDFCKNCGSAAHTEKYCLERTRKKKKNFMNKENDEDYLCVTQDLGYDGNRDRWVGYDPNNFDHIYREYEKIVEEQKKRKAEKLKKKYEKQAIKNKNQDENEGEEGGGEDSELSSDSEEGNDLNESKQNNKKNNKDEKNKTVARNLRIREDTAKYLYNLNLNSAFYDPKSRSMREDPLANIKNNLENSNYYKGENYYNNTGDAIESKKLEIFAWESYKRGENVHFNAQPTQLELMYKEFLEKKNKLIKKKQEDILKTYKCENITKEIHNEQELIHSEVYTEYKPADKIDIKKNNKIKVLSKYEEDIYISDHTSVFGSYYDRKTNKWGYKCCQRTDKFQNCFQS